MERKNKQHLRSLTRLEIVWRKWLSTAKHGQNDDFYELQLLRIWNGISFLRRAPAREGILHAAQNSAPDKPVNYQMESAAFLCHQHDLSVAEHNLSTWIAFIFNYEILYQPFSPREDSQLLHTLNLLFDKLLSSQWWCFFPSFSLLPPLWRQRSIWNHNNCLFASSEPIPFSVQAALAIQERTLAIQKQHRWVPI